MHRYAFILITLFFSAAPAWAAPAITSITGTPDDGGSITVNGTGFTTKSTAAPLVWDDFESHTTGALVSATGTWSIDSDESSTYQPKISTSNQRTGSTKSVLVTLNQGDISGSTYQHDLFYKDNLAFSSKIYVDMWVRLNDGEAVGNGGDGSNNYQIKLWRLACALAVPNEYPTISLFHWQEAGSTGRYGYYQFTREGSVGVWTDYFTALTQDTYTHFQMIVEPGTLGNADGNVRIYHNGALAAEKLNTQLLFTTGRNFDMIRLGEYVGNYSSISVAPTTNFDDVYIDNSEARVEIGNASTYSASTHREIQIPSAWSTTAATVTVNAGSFPNGQPAYLFVIDSSGAASLGYPITLGVAATPTPTPSPTPTPTPGPSAPRELRLNGWRFNR